MSTWLDKYDARHRATMTKSENVRIHCDVQGSLQNRTSTSSSLVMVVLLLPPPYHPDLEVVKNMSCSKGRSCGFKFAFKIDDVK
jgi:hypothetical protein